MSSVVVLVLRDLGQFYELVEAWHRVGAPAATIIDCTGSHGILEADSREPLPLFPSLRDILQGEEVARKIVFSVIDDDTVAENIIRVTEELMGNLSQPGKGILFVVPVSRVVGLRFNGRSVEPPAP